MKDTLITIGTGLTGITAVTGADQMLQGQLTGSTLVERILSIALQVLVAGATLFKLFPKPKKKA